MKRPLTAQERADLAPWRGIMYALLMVAPFWIVVLGFVLWLIVR